MASFYFPNKLFAFPLRNINDALLHIILGISITYRRCELLIRVYNFTMEYKIRHWPDGVLPYDDSARNIHRICNSMAAPLSKWLNFIRRVKSFGIVAPESSLGGSCIC